MKKTLFLTSILTIVAVTPAFAETSHTESTFPQNGQMQEDTTYTNQANVTNMKVSSGNATTTAVYLDCPSGWGTSDEGATSTDYCYKACTVADLNDAHAATASGKNYYGQSVADTCAIASCNEGYTLNPGNPDLTTIIGVTEEGTAYGYINHSGTYTNGTGSTTQQTYGITAPDTFAVDFGPGKGIVTGVLECDNQNVSFNPYDSPPNIPTSTTLTSTSGNSCWCKLDGYISDNGTRQSLTASYWVLGETGSDHSAQNCALYLHMNPNAPRAAAFRTLLFNSVPALAPSCDANVITITWDHADAADITANNAGSVTYGGDIRTPKKAQHISGKIFVGWTFNTPQ